MTRGGTRAGAGRKRLADEQRRVAVTIKVAPETKAALARLKSEGHSIGRFIDGLVSYWADTERDG